MRNSKMIAASVIASALRIAFAAVVPFDSVIK